MEMSVFKWLLVILLGGGIGVAGMWLLTSNVESTEPTFSQLIDKYGVQIESKSDKSLKYVGYKKNTIYEDFDSIQLTFSSLNDKFERSHSVAENKKKATDWTSLFCTDDLQDIAGEYDAPSNHFLGRVRVIIAGVVLTGEGQQGINALCHSN
ncbi:hypothetical protein CH64_364 [Yersinia rohdei]|uniref:Uncharacterized protein n=1 Tax=Yersinia rohdei TaxID=29485 RepID=A0ABN4EZH9_YERRO|nr:hypothetical protein [Yersinia rohdei]AJJ09432.1 hypothetical protein CH64_364 [Yersinia rohdei]EEQ02499.1 hypothetical protein yrohd0001_34170 [Yersinia rohdei ATCC 43380]CND95753.1 Uncharacterised protein [Yersinia rohdei]